MATETFDMVIRAQDQASQKVKKVKDSLDKLDKSQKKAAKGSKAFQGRIRDLSSNIAILDGPLGAVAGRLNAFGAVLGRLNPAVILVSLSLTAFFTTLGKGTKVAATYERAMFKISTQLRVTGNAAGLTAQQLDEMAISLGKNTLASSEGARDAISALLTFRGVAGDTFRETLQLAQDWTSLFGGDLRSNVVKLGKALESPREGLSALSRKVSTFTPKMVAMIAAMKDTGREAEATELTLSILREGLGEAGTGETQGLSGVVDTLGENWDRMTRNMAMSIGTLKGVTKASGVLSRIFGRIADSFTTINEMTLENLREELRTTIRSTQTLARVAELKELIKAREKDREVAKEGAVQAKIDIKANKEEAEILAFKRQYLKNAETSYEKYNEKIARAVVLLQRHKEGLQGLTEEEFVKVTADFAIPGGKELADEEKEAAAQARKLETLKLSLLTESEAVDASYLMKQDKLLMFFQNKDLTEKEYNELSLDNHRKYEDSRAKMAKNTDDVIVKSRAGALSGIGNLLSELGKNSKKAAIAALVLQKGIAISNIVTSTAAAELRAMAELGPIAGVPAAASIRAWGAVNIATVAATGLMQARSINTGGSVDTTFAPNEPSLSPTVEDKATGGTTTINIDGGFLSGEAIDELVEVLADAVDRNDTILIRRGTRNYQELQG